MESLRELSNEELVDLINKGDEKAVGILVDKNMGLCINICKSKYKNTNIPMDILLTESKIGIIKAIEKYDPSKGKFSTLIPLMIRTEIGHYIRNEHKMYDRETYNTVVVDDKGVENSLFDLTPDYTTNIEEEYEKREQLNELKQALDRLDEYDRKLIYLKFWRGMTLKEVCDELNLKWATAQRHTVKAMNRLKEEFFKIAG